MIFQQPVEDLIVENDRVVGAVTQMGLKFRAKAVADRRHLPRMARSILAHGEYSGGRAGILLQSRCRSVCENCRCALTA